MLVTMQRPASVPVRGRRYTATIKAISTPATPRGRPGSEPKPELNKRFTDKAGKQIKPMPVDWGFRSGAGRLYEEHYGEAPKSVWDLASSAVEHEFGQMRASYRFKSCFETDAAPEDPAGKALASVGSALSSAMCGVDEVLERVGLLPKLEAPQELTSEQRQEFKKIKIMLSQLNLNAEGVTRREAERIAEHGDFDTPAWVRLPFNLLSWTLDRVYASRPIQKFWVLETVARVPYFAAISCLQLYESLGFWRAGAELRKIHFAEELNELHHLQIMESLGGDTVWGDRFFAEHAAVIYYWVIFFMYLASPKTAYSFMRRVEHHASDTYTEFVEANKEVLACIPPPAVAISYYRNQDLYLFDMFQHQQQGSPRRPECNTLLDVFTNIRDDENEHCKTMAACQDQDAM